MKIFVPSRMARHETNLIDPFARSLHDLGHEFVEPPEAADLSIVWGWDRHVEGQPTIFMEVGWIPRWHYQVSHRGINCDSHLKAMPDVAVSNLDLRKASDHLWCHRSRRSEDSAFRYADPTGNPMKTGTPYALVPLQVEADISLRHSPIKTMQSFIDRLSLLDPPYRYIFRGHPALIAGHGNLLTRREQDKLFLDSRQWTVHQQLKSFECLGVITLNSNTAHDAIIWDKPVVAIARGSWPEDLFRDEVPNEWWVPVTRDEEERRLRYVHRMLQTQWILAYASDQERVAAMVKAAVQEVRE